MEFIITIARQCGSGGKEVGQMLAKRLGIPCYDREIISMASEDSGINPVLFEDEKLKSEFRALLKGNYMGTEPLRPESAGFTKDDNLYNFQRKVIQQIGQSGPCIIIGRCADYVLREKKNLVRVFVHAPEEACYEQFMKTSSLPEEEARREIARTDEYRAKFYKYHTGQQWQDAHNYDLALNSAQLGFEGTVEAILAYLAVREKYQPE